MNKTALKRNGYNSNWSPLDQFYNSIKTLFLQNHQGDCDKKEIEKMERYYDEMDSGDMNAVINSSEKEKEKMSYSWE